MPGVKSDVADQSVSEIGGREITCGVVMPISEIDGCSSGHWAEVLGIIKESLSTSDNFDYKIKIVSDADDAGVIQRRIVTNLYSCDIVVCDVSAKNSNVMFELGMRLAFDKPVVIIKDDCTGYSFDTGVIEHIGYPRDLRFGRIVDFKRALVGKCDQTILSSRAQGYSSFLSNFSGVSPAAIKSIEVNGGGAIVQMLDAIQDELRFIKRRVGLVPAKYDRGVDVGDKQDGLLSRMVNFIVSEISSRMGSGSEGAVGPEEVASLLGDAKFRDDVLTEFCRKNHIPHSVACEYYSRATSRLAGMNFYSLSV